MRTPCLQISRRGGEVKGMEKVDKLIEKLAENISRILESGREKENEVEKKTKALAELISARATIN